MTITELGDADGHIIEPGDLWVERLPEDLRGMAPHFFRDADGIFHQHIYGLDIGTLDVMQGGMQPRDMLQNMGLAAAMGQDLARVFSEDDRDRYTMVDAPEWTRDGKKRLEFNLAHGVGRAVLFPTFMLAGGTFQPHLAAAACRVYNDWILDDYCGGSGGRLIPVAALPIVFPLDMMHTLYDMMAGGVFDRFPTMQTMILEAGCGWIPSMFERWEEHMEMFGKVKAPAWKSKPMDIFLRQMMVTVEACEAIDINIALQHMPADHIALASDWPHYDGTPELLAGFRKATVGLEDEDVQMLATGTLERWFPSN
jgi:hypothetical protein